MSNFPGIEHLRNELLIRFLGDAKSQERFGMGTMDKSGITIDNRNYVFPDYVLVYVLNGRGTYIDGPSALEFSLEPGSFFQRIPGRIHSNYIDPNSSWKEIFIQIGPELFQTVTRLRCIHTEPLCGNIGLDLILTEKLWRVKQELRNSNDEEFPGILAKILELLFEIHRRAAGSIQDNDDIIKINEACDFLSRDFDRSHRLEDFCIRKGWGYESFRKKFCSRMGMSPNQYRIRRRIDAATALLGQRNHSITEIAIMLGYASPFEFSAQFKKYTGCTPSFFYRNSCDR